jgi:hypothetical protein
MRKLQIAIFTAALLIAAQARAAWYDITFSDPTAANVASVVAQVQVLNGIATSGSMKILIGLDAGQTYNLVAGGPGVTTSPLGVFNYDNVVYGSGTLPAVPFLDNAGLLFSNGTREMNLFWNLTAAGGNNIYNLDGWTAIVRRPLAARRSASASPRCPSPRRWLRALARWDWLCSELAALAAPVWSGLGNKSSTQEFDFS